MNTIKKKIEAVLLSVALCVPASVASGQARASEPTVTVTSMDDDENAATATDEAEITSDVATDEAATDKAASVTDTAEDNATTEKTEDKSYAEAEKAEDKDYVSEDEDYADQTESDTDTTTDTATTVDSDSDSYGNDTSLITVNVRVAIDGAWAYVGRDGTIYDSDQDAGYTPVRVAKSAYRAGGEREIVPASVLAEVLAPFGFAATDLARADRDYSDGSTDWGLYRFGYAPAGTANVFADVTPQLVDGSWYVFTMNPDYMASAFKTTTIDLYYLPANVDDGSVTKPASYYTGTSKAASDAQLLADSSFHVFTVKDDDNLIYAEGTLPAPTYVNACAGKADVTLNVTQDTYWDISGADVTTTDNGDGTQTLTLANVTGPVTATAHKAEHENLTVTYTAAMADTDRVALDGVPASSQTITDNATVAGSASTTVSIDATTTDAVTLPQPDMDSLKLTWSRRSVGYTIYSFKGWRIGDTVYAAGETIPTSVLISAADNAGKVAAKSVWSPYDDGTTKHIRTANFYLNLNCEILDTDGTAQQQSSDKYTASVAATRVWNTDTFGSDRVFTLLAPADTTSAAEVDAKIRAAARGQGIFPPASWTTYTDPNGVQLESLPTDEEVLARVRAGSYDIKIDGVSVDTSTITADNFTVRWAAVKYDATDGWHIDGVLVAKKARLTVTKTFEGESDALSAFAEAHGYASADDFDATSSFYVDVTHDDADTNATVTDYQLLLVPDSDLTRTDDTDRRRGYTSYDEATNTYTWEIDTRQYRTYTVSEHNYYLSSDDWNNLTWYCVRHSTNDSDTDGWAEYDAATAVHVTVLAAAYPTDTHRSAVQSVGFRNAYTHKGTLVVHKDDYATGQPMADVAFTVTQTNTGATSSLYRRKGTSEYTCDPSVYTKDPASYEKVDDQKAITDAQGVFYLSLAAPDGSSSVSATYTLAEDKSTTPGYEGADAVAFSLTYDEGIATGSITTTGGASDVTWAEAGENRFVLYVRNRSCEYTSVTAKKQWTTATTLPVTVQLWRAYGDVDEPVTPTTGETSLHDLDGNDVTDSQVLSTTNDWAATWANLPLFIDNHQVTYHLKETWIGSEAYDAAADTDGYADYAVTYEAARYATGSVPDTTLSGDALRALYPLSDPVIDAETGTFAKHVLLVVDNADVGRKITLTKVDADTGSALAGAVFALYSDPSCTDELERTTTASDGLVCFSEQPVGTYYIREVSAPAGYSFDPNLTWKATVSTGRPTVTLVGDETNTPVSRVTNELGASLTIVKVGADHTRRLPNATFELARTDSQGRTTTKTLTTASDGTLTFTGMRPGSYVLRETSAPTGYVAIDTPLAFTVSVNAETGMAAFTLDDPDIIDGKTYVSFDDVSSATNVAYSLTVSDAPDGHLPDTGSCALAYLGAACLALLAASLHMRRRA